MVEYRMQYGSKLQRETRFLESLEPCVVQFEQNDRTAKKVMTFSLREMKKEKEEEGDEKERQLFIKGM